MKLMKILSLQSGKIYKLLLKGKIMTAKSIGEELNIFPNAVYRALEPLSEMGLVRQLAKYPREFEAKPPDEAADLYSAFLRQDFQHLFQKNINLNGQTLGITFISKRKDLIEKTDRDLSVASKKLSLIVSGFEVPAETILGFKEAVNRGVQIKAIVQNLSEVTKELFNSWKKLGIKLRYFPNLVARIFVFDGKSVYFTSYNPERKEEAIGIRFDYEPIAKLMDDLFDSRWKASKPIS